MDKPKVVLWRPMYAPIGHELLADGGADVVVVDSPNADEVKQVLKDTAVDLGDLRHPLLGSRGKRSGKCPYNHIGSLAAGTHPA